MNEGDLALMMAAMDTELARAEPGLTACPEQTRQYEILRALSLGLGNFERMRADEAHRLAAQLSRGR